MRTLLIATLLLMPVAALGTGTKAEEKNRPDDDICSAQEEVKMAKDMFYREIRGRYNGESVAMLASEVDRKLVVYMQLQRRYEKQYGKPFDGDCHAGDQHFTTIK